jgi:ABC-type transport system involved in multi-copper enzyme maturation permease subunit
MPALPIVERELRVAARNRETYWSRSGVVLGLGLLWIPGLLGTLGTTTEINTFVFNGMLWAGFAVSCLACLFTADAISRERREGTLGLLFLSKVRVGDVLLGKLASSGFKGLCMLAAFLPMLMIPVLAGGVTGGEAFRVGLVLLNTFWFSLCAGLWASARSDEAFKSIKRACVLVGVVVLVPYLTFALSYSARTMPAATPWAAPFALYKQVPVATMEFLSPLTTLADGRDAFYKISPWPFWISLAVVQLFAWLLLLFTAVRLRHSLSQPDAPVIARPSQDRATAISGGNYPAHAPKRARRIRFLHAYSNPVDWLVQHQRGILATLWLAAAIEVFYFASSWAVLRGMFTLGWPSVIGWVTWFAASASTDALFARAGSKFFYESKRSGQLETLLTTPLGPRGVVEGQWSALKKLLAWPVAVALGAMLLDEDISLISEIGQPGGYSASWVTQCFITWSIDIAGSILGILAVSWFGMLFALKGKSAAGIMLRAAALGTGLPALFKTLYAFAAEHITFTVSNSGLWEGKIASWLEEIIVMAYYLWLFRLARKRVLRELSGTPSAPRESVHGSRITRYLAPRVRHATDLPA